MRNTHATELLFDLSQPGRRAARFPDSDVPDQPLEEMIPDAFRRDEDGYFYHGGRADDVIISAGYTMSAVEIEDVLLKHPDVDETCSPCSLVIWGIRAETFREAGKGSAVARSRTSSIPMSSPQPRICLTPV